MRLRAKRDIGSFVKSGEIYETWRVSPDFSKSGKRFVKCYQNVSLKGDTTPNPVNVEWPVGYFLKDFEVVT